MAPQPQANRNRSAMADRRTADSARQAVALAVRTAQDRDGRALRRRRQQLEAGLRQYGVGNIAVRLLLRPRAGWNARDLLARPVRDHRQRLRPAVADEAVLAIR